MLSARRFALIVICFALVLGALGSNRFMVTAATEYALQFDGVDDRVTFGAAPGLGAQVFTLELWFMKTGPGVGTGTGTNGLTSAVPLLTKGRSENDGPNVDANYFLGIDTARRVLAADFEDMATGLNHPIFGKTSICDNIRYHAAATCDRTTWRLISTEILRSSSSSATPDSTAALRQHSACRARQRAQLDRPGGRLLQRTDRRGPHLERRPEPGGDPGDAGRAAAAAAGESRGTLGSRRGHGDVGRE